MATIKERLAIVETEMKGIKKILWILVAASLTQVGIQIAPI